MRLYFLLIINIINPVRNRRGAYNTNKRGQRRITSLKRTEPLLTHLEFRTELRNGIQGLGPLDSTYSMNRNRRYFLSSRAHHDHHNLTPGLLRALILLFSIQSFVSPVECSFSGSELLTSGNRDGEKTSYKTPEGANKPTLLPY